MAGKASLREYRKKRDFKRTAEPRGGGRKTHSRAPVFVVQKHDATSRHYDFRLEVGGVLKSWAVPKGPSLDPKQKRLARATEDHPLDYAEFEGVIPQGEYGAGPVLVWDRGAYENLTEEDGSPVPLSKALDGGHIVVGLHGEKLGGAFALTRFKNGNSQDNWLLVKMKDKYADGRRKPLSTQPESVLTGRKIEQVGIRAKAGLQTPVKFSRVDKVFFPRPKITKGDLIEYYIDIAPTLLRHTKYRPIVMQRFPDGIGKKGFYHKNVPESFPDWIERVNVQKEGGHVTHLLCNDPATLAFIVNQGCITPHTWLSRRDALKSPDQLVFDLDPQTDGFEGVRDAAFALRELLQELGLEPYVKTTGSRGVHVLVPLDGSSGFDDARAFAQDVAEELTARRSDLVTVEQRKSKRGGKVFIDTARNAYAQTMAPAYAVRPKPGAPVSTPVDWRELRSKDLDARSYHLRNVRERLAQKDDPWRDVMRHARSLKAPARALAKLRKRDQAS